MAWLTLVSALFAGLTSGAPLGAALGLTGFIIMFFYGGGVTSLAIPPVWNVMTNFTFTAVPLFIFMGEILSNGGMSKRIYSALSPLFHRIPGKLLHTNVAVCTLFGAISGSSMSVAAAVGSVAYPELSRRGYDRPSVVGSLAGGGTLGLLIPPSLSLLIYGALEEVSVGRLFLAGILPGLMMSALFMIYIAIYGSIRRDLTPQDDERPSLAVILRSLWQIWPLPILIFAVLGTIYLGIATTTEAAGLGLLAAVVLGFLGGELTLRSLWRAFLNSTVVFGALALVMVGSLILAQAISILGLPAQILKLVVGFHVGKYYVLVIVVVIYWILGCFFDGTSLLLMTVPLVYPLMTGVGFDPIWLGVLITMLIEIGMITPPVGMNLFVLVSITNQEVTLAQAAASSVAYWLLLLLGIAIITVWPDIALYLPSFM